MSVTKPRLTPRLSRWPVPSTVRPSSSSTLAIIALTLDEPMSSAAISSRFVGRGHYALRAGSASLLARARRQAAARREPARRERGDSWPGRSARPARAAGGRSSCPGCAGRSAGCRGRAGRSTCRAGRICAAPCAAGFSPSGKRDRLARLEVEVPAPPADPGRARPAAASSVGTGSISRWRCARLARWRRGRSATADRACGRPARGRAPRLRRRSAPAAPCSATAPPGVRSTMSMTSVSGSRRSTRASLTQP